MSIIKLNATDSTNLYLKQLALSQRIEDFTVVSADLQLKGRGQMGSNWHSEKGNNLTISILKNLIDFQIQNQFNLNYIVSLAIYDVLHEMTVPNLSVKWPNDILSGNQKICGILIENILNGNLIRSAIMGIGLNVNQINFGKLEKVSSLKLLLGRTLELDELTTSILEKLKYYFALPPEELKSKYLRTLFRIHKASTFTNDMNEKFVGIIRGVDQTGRLVVELEDNLIKKFNLKEIKLLY